MRQAKPPSTISVVRIVRSASRRWRRRQRPVRVLPFFVVVVASALLAVVLGLTHAVFDRFHATGSDESAVTWWLAVRNALVVVLYVLLVVRLVWRRHSSSP